VWWVGDFEMLESSGGNQHVIVHLLTYELEAVERLMLQAFLGSDRRRELLNYGRMLLGQDQPIRLFRPKQNLLQGAIA
jgi:hypothetical protein